ncbi:MAG: hypothetical protein AAB370_11940 [Verrucomicrobiota bacterium]
MKTTVSIIAHEPISFVAPVTKAPADQGCRPVGRPIRSVSFSEGGRLRGALLIRFAARKDPSRISWL